MAKRDRNKWKARLAAHTKEESGTGTTRPEAEQPTEPKTLSPQAKTAPAGLLKSILRSRPARDFVLAILPFGISQGYAMSGLPPTILGACICWAATAIFGLDFLWTILPISRAWKIATLLTATSCLVGLLRGPVGREYRKERGLIDYTFSVDIEYCFVSDSGPVTPFMVGYPSTFGNTASPIFYLAYVKVANHTGTPERINNIHFAASKDAVGPWEDLVPIPLESKRLYALHTPSQAGSPGVGRAISFPRGTSRLSTTLTISDMTSAAVATAYPLLEQQLRNAIEQGHPINGWVALDSLRHAGLTPGRIFFRIDLRNYEGKAETHVIELPIRNPTDLALETDIPTIQLYGLDNDISGFHIKYFGDPFPPGKATK